MNDKIAQFHFELEDSSELTVSYYLQPNSLTRKWLNIVERRKIENKIAMPWRGSLSDKHEPLELKIANKTASDSKFLIDKLNSIICQINTYYDKPLPVFKDFSEIDRNTLNFLHEEFEVYGERNIKFLEIGYETLIGDPKKFPGTYFRTEFHQLWLDLNQWIHITETALEQSDFPNFSCLIQYLPFEENGFPIEEIDKLFLTTHYEWGGLYLGYNTLGKDYMHTMYDQDTRVITNDQVKVQDKLSSEVWLSFSKTNSTKEPELDFWEWYCSLDKEVQEKLPINNLNKLALGRYYLGNVIIDEAFLNFHPKLEDWLLPNSEIKKQWDLKVFSKITTVLGITIK
jgi:hypothetical protein